MFKTKYDKHERVIQNTGSPIRKTFGSRINSSGARELYETGSVNIYDEIQSHKDSVDINVILSRYTNGDLSALNRVQGVYGDFTNMPKTYAEMLNTVNAARYDFERLPLEIREKFDHNFEKYMVEMDNFPEWCNKMGIVQTAETVDCDPVVPVGESAQKESALNE